MLMLAAPPTHDDVNRSKTKVAAKYHLEEIPVQRGINQRSKQPKEQRNSSQFLRRKATRAFQA